MDAAGYKEKAPGDYPAAIGHYTSAILADGKDPTFPLNRAAAYLKLNKNEDAERDCTTVLKLQATNVKGLFRRAQARIALGKFTDARTDLVAAAKAEPGNAAIRAEFTKVEGFIAEAAKKAKASKGTPIPLPTHPRPQPQPSGTPYRRRVPIAIVNDDSQGDKHPDKGKGKADIAGAPPKGILKGTLPPAPAATNPTTAGASNPVIPAATQKSDDFLKPVSTRTLSSTSPAESRSQKPAAPAPVSPPVVVPSSSTVEPLTAPVPAPTVSISTPDTIARTPPPPEQDTTPPLLPLQPDATPPTLLRFLQRWSNTRTDAQRASILFSVAPDSIPTLFGPSLESPLLGAILSALLWALFNSDRDDVPQRTANYMIALSRVPRFPTLILFLDTSEKQRAEEIWDTLDKGQQVQIEDLAQERPKWGPLN
ncbi:RNA polymerase II-associated protein 3 [Ceratobasidium theobromae]|uniref:RNA polymerase II-associated protein 3 n=1 Tax=Ceratobasidium theobromae TaxID=1582974 RepID=A0A5N5QNH1_9AGAM|nr:RNA polymerase II-associated protein 3 [Ceratobasidium theobromae]